MDLGMDLVIKHFGNKRSGENRFHVGGFFPRPKIY